MALTAPLKLRWAWDAQLQLVQGMFRCCVERLCMPCCQLHPVRPSSHVCLLGYHPYDPSSPCSGHPHVALRVCSD